MSAPLHFFFDVASPYSYLAFARIHDVASAHGVSISYRPFLLGGVFRATHNQMPSSNPARAQYLLKDLKRCASASQIPFVFSDSFPNNSLLAMRTITAAPIDEQVRIAGKIFKGAWVLNRDIGMPDVLASLLGEDTKYLHQTNQQSVKDMLRKTTDDAIAAGAFGAPFFLVNDESFWGNDRLEMAVSYAATVE